MKKFALAACVTALALAAGCANHKDSHTGSMGMVKCAHGEDCRMSCCKDGVCKDGSCKTGSMGMVACPQGKDCTMSCCTDDGMCKTGACKSK